MCNSRVTNFNSLRVMYITSFLGEQVTSTKFKYLRLNLTRFLDFQYTSLLRFQRSVTLLWLRANNSVVKNVRSVVLSCF
jgi:hypothetical protein